MIQDLKKLNAKLQKVEKLLEKVRGCSPLTHGWQTQRYAKASRKWDILAQERIELIEKIEAYPCPANMICQCPLHNFRFNCAFKDEKL